MCHLRSILFLLVLVTGTIGAVKAQEIESYTANATHLSISDSALCLIDTENQVECLTSPSQQRLQVPDEIASAQLISLGKVHACVLGLGGGIQCWGNNDFGQLAVPLSATPAIALDAGEVHSCAINTAGKAVCWGLSDNGRVDVPDNDRRYVSISAGFKHSCAITDTGQLDCWGSPEAAFDRIPMDLAPVKKVETGLNYTCVLMETGEIRCYSGNTRIDVEIPDNGPYSDFTFSGGARSGVIICGLDASGTADCKVSPPTIIFDPSNVPLSQAQAAAEQKAEDLEAEARLAGPFVALSTATRNLETTSRPFDYLVYGCGINTVNDIECWSTPQAVDLGPLYIPTIDAQAYSDSVVEILWTPGSTGSIGPGLNYYEVWRDDRLLPLQFGNRSYLDETVQSGIEYTYQVRLITSTGRIGEFSNPVSVTPGDSGDQNSIGGYTPPQRPLNPANLEARVYGPRFIELLWDRAPTNLKGYEVYANGKFSGFTTGTSFQLDSLSPDLHYRFDVVAVASDGGIRGYSVIDLALGDTQICR